MSIVSVISKAECDLYFNTDNMSSARYDQAVNESKPTTPRATPIFFMFKEYHKGT